MNKIFSRLVIGAGTVVLTTAPSLSSAISLEDLEDRIIDVKASAAGTLIKVGRNTSLISKANKDINLNKQNITINKKEMDEIKTDIDKNSSEIHDIKQSVIDLEVTHNRDIENLVKQLKGYIKIVTKIKDTILPEEVGAIGTLSLRRCAGTHQVTWDKCVYKLGGKGPKGGIVFKIGDHGEHGSEVTPKDVIRQTFGCLSVNFNGDLKEYIGSGKNNTDVILNKKCTGNLAAKTAINFKLKEQGGWYLPSVSELKLMRNALLGSGVGGFHNNEYWSSSDNGGNNVAAYTFDFENNYKIARERSSPHPIRLVSDF